MYEQNEVPVFRRFLWIALSFIVAVVIIWLLVWLIFFRHSTPKAKTSGVTKQQTSQSTTKTPSSSSSTNAAPTDSTATGSATPNSTYATPGSATATPTELVNTGAGDMVVPFALASVAGSTLYYIRLRRKLLS